MQPELPTKALFELLDEYFVKRMHSEKLQAHEKITAKTYLNALECSISELEHLAEKCNLKPCEFLDIPEATCEAWRKDCGECLKWEFIKAGAQNSSTDQQALAVKDEVEGRKNMDAQDTKQTAKEELIKHTNNGGEVCTKK